MKHLHCIIPARLNASRFPHKPLALIDDKEMILHVLEKATQVKNFSEVWCATPDQTILDCVKSAGFNAILTPDSFATGSDRVAWAAQQLNSEYIVNIQGDEPLISVDFLNLFSDVILSETQNHIGWWTSASPLNAADHHKKSCVKINVIDGYAQKFFRSGQCTPETFKHRGVYAFSMQSLNSFSQIPQSHAEKALSLEQLRVFPKTPFRVILDESFAPSVDTPQDLIEIKNLLKISNSNLNLLDS